MVLEVAIAVLVLIDEIMGEYAVLWPVSINSSPCREMVNLHT